MDKSLVVAVSFFLFYGLFPAGIAHPDAVSYDLVISDLDSSNKDSVLVRKAWNADEIAALLASVQGKARVWDFEVDLGGEPNDDRLATAFRNGAKFNDTINNLLRPGDTLLIPANKTFWLSGGIKAEGMSDVTWQIDGTIKFVDDRDTWPKKENGDVEECIYMSNISNVIFTSRNSDGTKGVMDGNGRKWWGAIRFLLHQEDRPRLLHINNTRNILMENLLLKDSPYWTFYAAHSDGLIIRHTNVDARITQLNYHSLYDLTAFNTDGFDVTGQNVYIHDCDIWCQDDCVTIKDGSRDMLIERITCSGLGLVIGSIGSSTVHNITFRDSYMYRTVKGIYMKTRWTDEGPVGPSASISKILYHNITMVRPQQYAIWIGPAQQTGQPCDLLWTIAPIAKCIITAHQTWSDIVLRDIRIIDPDGSAGVLLGNSTNPMTGVVFDNVVVENPGKAPWGSDMYYCEGINGIAMGSTSPVPPCFETAP